jgi:hypothetical protein
MATTTTNFGWDIPQSTDLVKDGATAIAALGQDIDTALVDLKGGTTNQVLSKASGTDLDFSWVTSSAGALTLITTQALSGVTSQSINSCFSATYANYLIVLNAYCATGAALPSLKLRVSGTDATSSYYSSFTARSWTDTLQSAASGNAGSWDQRPFGEMQASSSNPGGTSLTLFSPFAVTNTSYHSTYLNQSTSGSAGLSGGVHNSATSYDGFTITNAYAMTGTVRVYGLGI